MGEHRPDYGPRGYLPDRAARRARKIVLREQLGVGWVVASVLAGVLLLATGAAYLWWQSGPPGAPYAAVGALDELPAGHAVRTTVDGTDLLLVRAGGRPHALAAPLEAVEFCPASGHLESAAGGVWALDGQRLDAAEGSLARFAALVHQGTVYVDASAPEPPVPPADRDVEPACEPPS